MIKSKNNLRLFLVIASVAGFAATPQISLAAPDSAYQRAVDSYITAANAELHAIRQQLTQATAGADEQKKALYASITQQLDECDGLVQKLSDAGPGQFDPLKAKYEEARSKLLKKLAEVQGTSVNK